MGGCVSVNPYWPGAISVSAPMAVQLLMDRDRFVVLSRLKLAPGAADRVKRMFPLGLVNAARNCGGAMGVGVKITS